MGRSSSALVNPLPGVLGSATDAITRGAGLAYMMCVGRAPDASELASWIDGARSDESCASMLCELHRMPESERFRKSTWTVFASAGGPDVPATVLDEAIVIAYQRSVGRTPAEFEIEIWRNNIIAGLAFSEFLHLMNGSAEAVKYQKSSMSSLSDGQFVQLAYESTLGYGIGARELASWQEELASGRMDRTDALKTIFKRYAGSFTSESEAEVHYVHDALNCSIACTGKVLNTEIWNRRAQELRDTAALTEPPRQHARFYIQAAPRVLVTAIASLYRGGRFIEQFMDNITGQSCFRDYCELVIVDADSPENESEVIERYCRQHRNITYQRMNYRIGIYDAWNVGARLARGEYLTNTNMDDLRRHDSLELQASVLENLPFVDVAYQDFYYTFDPSLSFDEIARMGFKGNVPVVTPHNMMDYNAPHNAPMWRKRLHEELGYFDTSYKSAGDYEFWMRCLVAGKQFYKINDAHVVYYQNPDGISTRPDTRGVQEGRRIFKSYARRLVPETAVIPKTQFAERCGPTSCDEATLAQSTRYEIAQHALRALAMTRKFTSAAKGVS